MTDPGSIPSSSPPGSVDQIELFAAELLPIAGDPDRLQLDVKLLPFDVTITRGGRPVRFAAGSVTVPAGAVVPFTIDHGTGTLDHIGRLVNHRITDAGIFGTFQLSDTAAARDVYQLAADGVLDQVSAGVHIESATPDPAGVDQLAGTLHHGSIVAAGAFGPAAHVIAVHSQEDQPMDNATPAAETVTLEAFTAAEERVNALEKLIAEMSVPGNVTEPDPGRREFSDKRDFVLTLAAASAGDAGATERIARFALADDTTTTAAGVVPDYLSSAVIEIIDGSRPYIDSLPKDPAGDYGMSVVFPHVTQAPTVAAQSAEKAEVSSQAMTIVPKSVDLVTYAGASDVARQLIERSQPSFVDILYRHYADQYARVTDGAAFAAGVSGATGTAVLADLSASASATFAAVNTANAAIIAGSRKPATHWGMGATRWAQLNSLVDSTGRPLLVFPDNGPTNAQGQGGFNSMVGQYHGLIAYLDPNAAATAALLYNDEFASSVETSQIQLRAEVVSLLGFELGVYGLFAPVVKTAAAGYTLTAS